MNDRIRAARRDGALLVRDLVDRDALAALRVAVQALTARFGWTEAVGDPVIAVTGAAITGRGWDDPDWIALQQAVALCPEFGRVRDDRGVHAVLAAIYGEPARGGQGDTCRIALPGRPEQATRPHQDLRFFSDASHDLWAVWLPLVDCPLELGPLGVVPGSGADGLRTPPDSSDPSLVLPADTKWRFEPLAPGDALFVHGLTIHRAAPNLTRRRVRLSVDFRYRPESEFAGDGE